MVKPQSAAEAAAAAIQERQRGVLIGAQTHGKSEIQTTVRLGDGSLLHLLDRQDASPRRANGIRAEG